MARDRQMNDDGALPVVTTILREGIAIKPQRGHHPHKNEVEGLNRGWAYGAMSPCPVA